MSIDLSRVLIIRDLLCINASTRPTYNNSLIRAAFVLYFVRICAISMLKVLLQKKKGEK